MSPKKAAKKNLVQRRPAETGTPVAMVVAMLIGRALHLEADTIVYISILVAFVPAAITWTVTLIRG